MQTLSHIVKTVKGSSLLCGLWHDRHPCVIAVEAALLDVDLANNIVQLAVASGEWGPFQQVLGEYKMVTALPLMLDGSKSFGCLISNLLSRSDTAKCSAWAARAIYATSLILKRQMRTGTIISSLPFHLKALCGL